MVRSKFYHKLLLSFLLFQFPMGMATAQNSPSKLEYSAEGDVTTVTRYIWRGQRLTDDWSLQPSFTLGIGKFSFNIWGNLDLAAVNEGDALFIKENPAATAGNRTGLRGKFSEVDYTFSYSVSTRHYTVTGGTITYTFPERSASLPSTTEIYGGIQLDKAPFAPFVTLYLDVDETKEAGKTGFYLQTGASHFIPFGRSRIPGVEVSGSLGFANSGFSNYYYGNDQINGLHDLSIRWSIPIVLGERWSAETFVAFSALLGDFRQHQFRDPREVLRGTAGSPSTFADTVWGGVSLNLKF